MNNRSLKSTVFLAMLMCSAAFAQGNLSTGSDDNGPAFLPAVRSMTPSKGPVGTKVVLKGTNLSKVTGVLFTPSIEVKAKALDDYRIEFTVPAGAQTGPVVLETLEGFSRSTPVFNVATTQ